MKIIWFALLLAACDGPDNTNKLARTYAGSTVACVREHTAGDRGISISLCTDGVRLIICTNDDGCIAVPLSRAMELPEAAR